MGNVFASPLPEVQLSVEVAPATDNASPVYRNRHYGSKLLESPPFAPEVKTVNDVVDRYI